MLNIDSLFINCFHPNVSFINDFISFLSPFRKFIKVQSTAKLAWKTIKEIFVSMTSKNISIAKA